MEVCSYKLRLITHPISNSVLLPGFLVLLASLCGHGLARICQLGHF